MAPRKTTTSPARTETTKAATTAARTPHTRDAPAPPPVAGSAIEIEARSGAEAGTDVPPRPELPALLPTAAEAEFPHPWMIAWSRAAAATPSAVEACRQAEVSLMEYLAARSRDPRFGEVCTAHDNAVDECIKDALRRAAIGGDPRSQSLYYSSLRPQMMAEARSRPSMTISAKEAEVIVAGLLRSRFPSCTPPPPDLDDAPAPA